MKHFIHCCAAGAAALTSGPQTTDQKLSNLFKGLMSQTVAERM